MKIKTITCHDVYNAGAGLQAYALARYLREQGHDVQIIDYKPDYLSRHYSLTTVNNPKYDRPLIRQAYLLAKLPGRLRALSSERKKRFDRFRSEMLELTSKRYESNDALKADLPEADVYIAGSDQIWNPLFPNGKDPAFFLDFVPEGKKKISYAASFAVDELPAEDCSRMQPWLRNLDAIAVREKSGVQLLDQMGLSGIQVCDPVFLLDKQAWAQMVVPQEIGVLVYDFDASDTVTQIVRKLSEDGKWITSVFPMAQADQVLEQMGPLEFMSAVAQADVVVSNSFHATAFALIFHKEFFVLERRERINTRMRDLLESVGLGDRMICSVEDMAQATAIDWADVDEKLGRQIEQSKRYLEQNL